jgi:hypothetical protein
MPVHIQDKISLLQLYIISLILCARPLCTVTTNHPQLSTMPLLHKKLLTTPQLPKNFLTTPQFPNNFFRMSLPKIYTCISTRGRIHLDIFAPIPVLNDVTNFLIGLAAPRYFDIQVSLYFTVSEGSPSIEAYSQALTMDFLFSTLGK